MVAPKSFPPYLPRLAVLYDLPDEDVRDKAAELEVRMAGNARSVGHWKSFELDWRFPGCLDARVRLRWYGEAFWPYQSHVKLKP